MITIMIKYLLVFLSLCCQFARSSNNNNCKGTYLTIGQDYFSIQQYMNSMYEYALRQHDNNNQGRRGLGPVYGGETFHLPSQQQQQTTRPTNTGNDNSAAARAATKTNTTPSMADIIPYSIMSYTNLTALAGLDAPVDYGSGVEWASGIIQELNLHVGVKVNLQLGLDLGGAEGCQSIVNGELDGQIDKLKQFLTTLNNNVFLRLGYEFDNPVFRYTDNPGIYTQAYKYLHKKLSMAHVQFVWHSWAAGISGQLSLDQFYPGDDVVDWVGVSVFQQVYPWTTTVIGGGTKQDVIDVINFANAHNKPTMIAESTPFGGIVIDNMSDEMKGLVSTYNVQDPWNRWFEPVLKLINDYDIKMWCYINCNWDVQPMWKGVGFGNSLINSEESVLKQFYATVYANNNVASRLFRLATDHDDVDTAPCTTTMTSTTTTANNNNNNNNNNNIKSPASKSQTNQSIASTHSWPTASSGSGRGSYNYDMPSYVNHAQPKKDNHTFMMFVVVVIIIVGIVYYPSEMTRNNHQGNNGGVGNNYSYNRVGVNVPTSATQNGGHSFQSFQDTSSLRV